MGHSTLQGWPDKQDGTGSLKSYYLKRNQFTVEDGCLLRGTRVIIPVNMGKLSWKITPKATRKNTQEKKKEKFGHFSSCNPFPSKTSSAKDNISFCALCRLLLANTKHYFNVSMGGGIQSKKW